MNLLDWLVLLLSLFVIAGLGVYKNRKQKDLKSYLLADQSLPWHTVGISIMATQASAITFLSAPGQAYTQGMGFVQFYLGLPLAMIVLSVWVIPVYHKLNIYTAYQFLESRLDYKTRALAAFLFLIQRGLAAGLTIYAPAIILSALLHWNIYLTNLLIGGLVVIYTTVGGSAAVGQTHKQQMTIILLGMLLAGVFMVMTLPENVSLSSALRLSGAMGKLETLDFNFDLSNKYNFWSGLIGGFFLMLSYFGTDQSQVQRYLSAGSMTQSRLGLLFNGLLKIPMQFSILLLGALLVVWYLFINPPLYFNQEALDQMKGTEASARMEQLKDKHQEVVEQRKSVALRAADALDKGNDLEFEQVKSELQSAQKDFEGNQAQVRQLMDEQTGRKGNSDTNYIFLRFVLDYFPPGLIGLLIAVIFAASMSSTSSELNALATTTMIDLYQRGFKPKPDDRRDLFLSKLFTAGWGMFAIGLAMFAGQLGSLIEAVNVLGSLFYGTILGIFMVALFFKYCRGTSVFFAAILAEVVVLLFYFFSNITFLWFNLIGCVLVLIFSLLLQALISLAKTR
jgi:solute:Na+ symporter, SSS family